MHKVFFFAPFLCFLSVLSSCTKHVDPNAAGGICDRLHNVKIVTNKTTYYIGDTIDIGVTDVVNGFYTWRHSVIPNDLSTDSAVHIEYATKDYQGWFYLNINNVDCGESVNDSIYIKVINKPADAPCNPTNNTASFSLIPNISFSTTTYDIDPSYNRKYIRGYLSSGYPDIVVYFHPYWLDKEPEDGEYNMGNGGIGFGSSNVYEVFITSTYSNIFFEATGGKAYVSHVNGKLQVMFCDVPLSGSFGGSAFTTTVTGRMTAP